LQHLNSLTKSQQDGVIALIDAAAQQDGYATNFRAYCFAPAPWGR
jgi:hypothetical protein